METIKEKIEVNKETKGGFLKRLRAEMGIKVFRFNSPCILCGKNMRVAPGQIAYFHKECRTKGRELVKRAK